ncbi:glycoside hydrolase family 13 protein [Acrocarpospora catenulata]|uniref:glycoside hydrolase family 13 protein n=1 Tax=Acrocarpospora catenulata TaxID=2836182 RepID=UPI001BDB525D|nr:glycoside hydrolase family 13 protein [Acrocarpospora catenulata]
MTAPSPDLTSAATSETSEVSDVLEVAEVSELSEHDWHRDAVIYQVYVRSFADGNGDGVGDLLGVRSRLRYLAELGVDAVWLTPFYPSPMADFGYDVADYRDVDPVFGSLGDARALIEEAHGLGLRIIVDVVPNHTSDRHAWFAAAVQAGPGSPERDRYIFREGRGGGAEPPNDWESIFGGPAWTRLPDGQWYLHLFAPEQPDLNWEHPEVHEEFADVLRFWLDLGVDGFRIDVAHGMIKAPGLPDVGHSNQVKMIGAAVVPYFDQDGVHEIYRAWRRILDSYPGRRIGVAEAWAPTPERLANYVRPDELHQAFNFHFLTTPWQAAGFRDVIEESLATSALVGAPATWVLSNHDVKRHATRYGGGAQGLARARAAAMVMLALPGSSYVYQGEELGLPEVLDLPEEVLRDPQRLRDADSGRDGCRVPMPWSPTEEPPFGFSPPGITETWLPMPADWRHLSVESQLADPDSTLSLYKLALAVRRDHRDLGDGTLTWREAPDGVLAFDRGESFRCLANMTNDWIVVDRPGELLLASAHPAFSGNVVRLAPDSATWWAVENV